MLCLMREQARLLPQESVLRIRRTLEYRPDTATCLVTGPVWPIALLNMTHGQLDLNRTLVSAAKNLCVLTQAPSTWLLVITLLQRLAMETLVNGPLHMCLVLHGSNSVTPVPPPVSLNAMLGTMMFNVSDPT